MAATAELRPSADRVRETLFNWLMHDIVASTCLDLFAGTGILGLEALSRGASFVQFVEHDRGVVKQLQSALTLLNAGAQAEVQCSTAATWLEQHAGCKRYDLLFIDPPFQQDVHPILVQITEQNIMTDQALVYVEQGKTLDETKLPIGWSMKKYQHYGQVHYYLFVYRR